MDTPMSGMMQLTGSLLVVGLVGWLVWQPLKRRAMLDISGRWFVVTGCDSGIGAGVVNRLVEAGASVIAFTFTEEGAKAALDAGAKLAPCLDITDGAALRNACDQVEQACGGQLSGVVHNAGIAQPGFIEFQPIDCYRRTMEVNLFSIINLTQMLIPQVRAAGGRFVVITSVDGIVSLPGNAPYDASKFAAEGYADALRVELSLWNVGVSVVNPSTLRTPLVDRFFESARDTWEEMERIDPEGEWKKVWTREWLEKYVEQQSEGIARIAQDPKCAVEDIYHALAAKRPRMRYLSGKMAKTFFYALWVMPERWSHAIKKVMIYPKPNIKLNT
jgi:NAD(P)-dependent dehydrogenase (short-subunit alcohol dehydrogenase family)